MGLNNLTNTLLVKSIILTQISTALFKKYLASLSNNSQLEWWVSRLCKVDSWVASKLSNPHSTSLYSDNSSNLRLDRHQAWAHLHKWEWAVVRLVSNSSNLNRMCLAASKSHYSVRLNKLLLLEVLNSGLLSNNNSNLALNLQAS
jgi:hypothetical protein